MDLHSFLCDNINISDTWGLLDGNYQYPENVTYRTQDFDLCRNLSFKDLLGNDPFQKVMHALNIYFTPVIILVGGAGNLLSFLVFTVTHLKRQSSSIYLASLAIVDIIFLMSLTFIWLSWIRVPLFYKRGWCQSVVYLTYVTTFLSVWYVVSFTIDRYIIVHYPLRKDRLCSPQRAKKVVTALGVVALVLYSFATFTSDAMSIDGVVSVCMPLPHFYSVLTVATALDTAFRLLLPSLAIVILNVRIALKIVRVSKQHMESELASDIVKRSVNHMSEMNSSLADEKSHNMVCSWTKHASGRSVVYGLHKSGHSAINGTTLSARQSGTAIIRIKKGRNKAQHRTARMLIIVSIVFVSLNLPYHAFRIHAFFSSSMDDMYMMEHKALRWQEFCQLLYHLNFSINFFLYSAYARQFRTGLRILYLRFLHKLHAIQQHFKSLRLCGHHETISMDADH